MQTTAAFGHADHHTLSVRGPDGIQLPVADAAALLNHTGALCPAAPMRQLPAAIAHATPTALAAAFA
ncbi:hypothetical protein ACU12_09370 [Xanthomonas oryzae pv. oryzicola]|nr:hypothetical protein ACU12_09370 [Xanthomonas oryzae pv. oryzicola]